jgi:hypothetical protein
MSNNIEEGWFGDLFKGDDYSRYSSDLQEVLQDLMDKMYYDKELITNIRSIYDGINKSDMDRQDKRELLDIMYGLYQTIETSKRKMDSYLFRLNRLK